MHFFYLITSSVKIKALILPNTIVIQNRKEHSLKCCALSLIRYVIDLSIQIINLLLYAYGLGYFLFATSDGQLSTASLLFGGQFDFTATRLI